MAPLRSYLLLVAGLYGNMSLAQRTNFVHHARPTETHPVPVAVTGADGIVVTYIPSQDQGQISVTEVVTIPTAGGGEIVVYPGGWIWEVQGPKPNGPLPPAPTTAPMIEKNPNPSNTDTKAEDPDDIEGSEATVTGEGGALVTYAASQDPEYEDVTKITTKSATKDDDDDIIIFPAGWIWKIKGPAPPGPVPPPPSGPPGPGSGTSTGNGGDSNEDGDENQDENEDEDEDEECSSPTAHPECTRTISYISSGAGYATTELGDCETVTKCVSGQQTTTTTTIQTSKDVIIAPGETVLPLPKVEDDDFKLDEDFEQYLQDYYESKQISMQDVLVLRGEPICKGGLVPVAKSCLSETIDRFCQIVDKDPKTKQKKKLDAKICLKKDTIARRAHHFTSLEQRNGKANPSSCSSHFYNFEWSGADGDCNSSCKQAMGSLGRKCGRAADAVEREGKAQVSCGQYKYWISEKKDGEKPDSDCDVKQENEDEGQGNGDDNGNGDSDQVDDEDTSCEAFVGAPVEAPVGSGGPCSSSQGKKKSNSNGENKGNNDDGDDDGEDEDKPKIEMPPSEIDIIAPLQPPRV